MKSKHLLVDEFNKELLNILFCVTYFGGFDSQRPTAGPPPPDYSQNLFPGVTTIADVFHSVRGITEVTIDDEEEIQELKTLYPPILLVENYPASASSLPHTPEVSYFGNQLDAILG